MTVDVPDDAVVRWAERGYIPEQGWEPPAEPAEVEEPDTEPVPGPDSTIAEIRHYAASHGVELPERGNKAKLLETITSALEG